MVAKKHNLSWRSGGFISLVGRYGLVGGIKCMLNRRRREKRRLELLTLVRKVREEKGDYDRVSTTSRRSVQRQIQQARFRNDCGQVRKAVQPTVRKLDGSNS